MYMAIFFFAQASLPCSPVSPWRSALTGPSKRVSQRRAGAMSSEVSLLGLFTAWVWASPHLGEGEVWNPLAEKDFTKWASARSLLNFIKMSHTEGVKEWQDVRSPHFLVTHHHTFLVSQAEAWRRWESRPQWWAGLFAPDSESPHHILGLQGWPRLSKEKRQHLCSVTPFILVKQASNLKIPVESAVLELSL